MIIKIDMSIKEKQIIDNILEKVTGKRWLNENIQKDHVSMKVEKNIKNVNVDCKINSDYFVEKASLIYRYVSRTLAFKLVRIIFTKDEFRKEERAIELKINRTKLTI